MNYYAPPKDKYLLLILFTNTTLNCALPGRSSTTTKIRDHLCEFFPKRRLL